MFKPIVANPISIFIGEGKAEIVFANNESFDLKKNSFGIIFDTKLGHFGIRIIRDGKTEEPAETIYFTQCEISGIKYDHESKTVRVYEENKYPISWEFDKNGKLLRRAEFYKTWRPTREFVYNDRVEIDPIGELYLRCGGALEDYIDLLVDTANKANNVQLDGAIRSVPNDSAKTTGKPAQTKNSDGGKA